MGQVNISGQNIWSQLYNNPYHVISLEEIPSISVVVNLRRIQELPVRILVVRSELHDAVPLYGLPVWTTVGDGVGLIGESKSEERQD